jgi:high affinity sulfate transporter 1
VKTILKEIPSATSTWWRTIFPPAQWVPSYQSTWLASDLVAGITLAAYAVPVSLAYATLAGLPPHVGVYGYLLGGLGYALLGSSRHLAIGPTSAISLLVGASVATMAGGDPVLYAQIATLTGFMVALLCLLAWVLNLSTLTNFISETILLGFKAGAALSIASTQLPGLLGVPGGGAHFFARIYNISLQLGDANMAVMAIGFSALLLLALGERFLPGRPVAFFVVVLSIMVAWAFDLHHFGVVTVGQLPEGLPSLRLPTLHPREIDGVIPLAAACVLLAYIESISAARAFAAKYGYPLDVRQELLSLGGANLAVALGQGYPVAGGLSQSAVNEKAGAKTPLALLFASATLALSLLFLTGLLRNLPKAVLAAIVLMAVTGLINVRELRRVWRVSRLEFQVAMIALVGVLLLGILKGVLLAAVASILLLLRRVASPHVAFLGRIPGTRRYSDLERHPNNEKIPGVVAFRTEAALLYFNADNILHDVLTRVRQEEPDVRLVVCDLSTSPYVDLAGATMLLKLGEELQQRGISLRFAEAHAFVRDLLRAEGLDEKISPINRFTSVADVIEDFQQQTQETKAEVVPGLSLLLQKRLD